MNDELARIKSRQVIRYYYRGKGYASLFSVCRVIAKDEFKTLVYGPDRELAKAVTTGLEACFDWPDPDAERGFKDRRTMLLSELVAAHFPHDETCLRPYRCTVEPTYPGCKRKVDAWILSRTRELMKEWKV